MRPIMVGALALLLGACGGTSFSVAQGDDALSLPPPAEAAAMPRPRRPRRRARRSNDDAQARTFGRGHRCD